MSVEARDAKEAARAMFRFAVRLSDVIDRALASPARRLVMELKQDSPRRTGALAMSWRFSTAKNGEIRIWSDLPYARILDRGGIIRGNPWLTIPMPWMPTRQSVKTDPYDTFLYVSKRSRKLMIARRTETGRLQIRYRLVRSARISALHYTRGMIRLADKILPEAVLEEMDREASRG